MPIPPIGVDIIGLIFWLLLFLLLGGAVIVIARSLFSETPQHPATSRRLDETMGELLREIKMLREEIRELRKDMKE